MAATQDSPTGPLHGVRVVELEGIGPGPFAGCMLADMGADVVSVGRPVASGSTPNRRFELLRRGKRSIVADLKSPSGVETLLALASAADALIEPFRPGVAERLGVGPEDCMAGNARLVYGRMTGWGQGGPYADAAGHDINYIALAGALWHFGRVGERPVPPLNVVADFGGGGMLLAFGMLCGVIEASQSGRGQIVDAAMVDGAAAMMTMFHGFRAADKWVDQRGVNTLDTGAPYYEVYETSDHQYVAVGAVEPQFYRSLIDVLGLTGHDVAQDDRARWPEVKERFASVFRTRTREEWCAAFEGHDACFAPVLSMEEAPWHPHNVDRGTFITIDGVLQPAPAPRFSRTPGQVRHAPAALGEHTAEVLSEWLG